MGSDQVGTLMGGLLWEHGDYTKAMQGLNEGNYPPETSFP